MTDLYSQIKRLHLCLDAIDWFSSRSLEEAWADCERGDWMLRLADEAGVERKLIVFAACDCVEPALEFAKGDEAETAIRTARRWCAGKATLDEVMTAARAADAAARAAFQTGDDAAEATAEAAAYVLDALDGADADDAVYAAACAAARAVNTAHVVNAARAASLKHSAELVRARIPVEVVREALKGECDE